MVSLRVKNNGREPVFFTECFQLHSSECITLKDELNVTKDKPLLLQPGNVKIVYVIDITNSREMIAPSQK